MLGALARRLFGSANDRYVKSLGPIVSAINELEPQLVAMSDDELRARTQRFKEQVADGVELDDILVDAFATVREAAKRTLGQRHFDVQLMGGVVLHRGMIAEMKTGEGKTLVATLPVYLNALTGKGVHVVTVNDYLARRASARRRLSSDYRCRNAPSSLVCSLARLRMRPRPRRQFCFARCRSALHAADPRCLGAEHPPAGQHGRRARRRG